MPVAVAGTVLSLLLAEIGLRAVGFSYPLYPEKIEFGWPTPEQIESYLRAERELFWVSKDYFRDLDIARRTRPSVVFMGCSCTQWGRYDEILARMVPRAFPQRELSYANLGVAGWTTHQGLLQLKRDVLGIKPKVVTIFYGWNDHWIGFGVEDKGVTKLNSSSILFRIRTESRLAQLVTKSFIGAFKLKGQEPPVRVSAADFKGNLTEMVRLSRENGIIPVLLTAPSSHEKGSEPEYLTRRHLRNLDDLIPLHQQYVSIVREVAKAENVILCDLAAAFEKLPREDVRSRYFLEDGIHLRPEGSVKLAELLFRCFEQAELFDKILR